MTAKMRLPYGDGEWFAVPLRDDAGFGVGLVAAHDGRGGVIGYFFNRRLEEVPLLADVTDLDRRDVLRVMRFGDLGLIKDQWPRLGRSNDWDPAQWPIPDFCRREPNGTSFRVVYSAGDLRGPVREEAISDAECDQLPRDALSGSGAVERVLTDLLTD